MNIGGLESMNKLKSLISTPLLVFIIITVVGFLSITLFGDEFLLSKVYAALDVASAVALATLAFMVYFKYGKQLQAVTIFIEKEGEEIELPIKIIRKNFTRSELSGVLRALDKKGKFDIAYMSTIIYFQDIEDVQEGKKDNFIIKLGKEDKFEF